MLYVAFYKGNYNWHSKLIKFWTKSQYSHCELYDGNFLIGVSSKYKRVRKQPIKLDKTKWDLYPLKNLTCKDADIFFEQTKGKKYDWKGILLSQIFNLRKQNANKYTCSEWIAEFIDKYTDIFYPKNYISITPQDIKELIDENRNIRR